MYTATYPYGELRFFPVPTQDLTLVLTQWAQFERFESLGSDIDLPPGYELAIVYNLALELAPIYGKAQNRGSFIFDRAESLLADLQRINTKPIFLKPEMSMIQKGRYSIYSDSTR
jgi:hypothetical protein